MGGGGLRGCVWRPETGYFLFGLILLVCAYFLQPGETISMNNNITFVFDTYLRFKALHGGISISVCGNTMYFISTITKWGTGSEKNLIGQLVSEIMVQGRTNIRQLVLQLSLSENVVQGEPIHRDLLWWLTCSYIGVTRVVTKKAISMFAKLAITLKAIFIGVNIYLKVLISIYAKFTLQKKYTSCINLAKIMLFHPLTEKMWWRRFCYTILQAHSNIIWYVHGAGQPAINSKSLAGDSMHQVCAMWEWTSQSVEVCIADSLTKLEYRPFTDSSSVRFCLVLFQYKWHWMLIFWTKNQDGHL